MAVETQHPQYILRAPQWKRCRDAAAGQDAIHAAGEAYLPKLSEQESDEYNAYKKRAGFFNAMSRTLSGLIGMLFRKPPTKDIPDGIANDMLDIDMKGKPLDMFAQDIAFEALNVGRLGVLVDHAVRPPIDIITVAAASELNLRPMLALYKAEDIINWDVARINNACVLALVVLTECFTYPVGQGKPDEPFGPKSTEFSKVTETRYRVLDLDVTNSNTYRQRVFRKDKNQNDQLVETIIPLMNEKPLDFIPFSFIGPDGIDIEAEKPPMLDLVDINIAHYRVTADYEHGCHFTGLPTAVISGYSDPQAEKKTVKFKIGSTVAWVFSDPKAKATYLEFSGQGLQSLENNLDRKEGQMAILGARMLAPEKKTAETATTSAIHRTGENSVLSGVGISVSLAITNLLKWFAQWASITDVDSIKYEVTRDFMPVQVDAPTLTAWVKAWQAGAISFETFFDLLQRGDMIESEKTAEDEQKEIEENPAPPPSGTLDPNPPEPGVGSKTPPNKKPAAAKKPKKAT